MTSARIADNLAHSRRRWGQHNFYATETRAYCVLGLKLAEAGIPKRVLHGSLFPEVFDEDVDIDHYPRLNELISLNDACSTKQELIEKLRGPEYRRRAFPIETFIRRVKAALHKRQKEARE